MKIFIIGQSNVGKSYLFNQLCGRDIAITQNEENTTVDLISFKTEHLTLFDTPGIDSTLPLYEADLFLYKIRDSGLDSIDELILKNIYKSKIPVILVSKYLDGLPSVEKYSSNNEEISLLKSRLGIDNAIKYSKPIIVIIGKENSGKSTLMNKILGYERCKVSEIAGTTKDSIIEEHREFCFVDTAGYCKEKTYIQRLISQKRREILRECDGAILLLDGSKPITKMEKQLMSECKLYSRFFAVAINKEDLLDLESELVFNHFHFGNFPVVRISALYNKINPLLKILKKIYINSKKIIHTSNINSWLSKNQFKLFDQNNTPVRVKYIIQSAPNRFKYFAPRRMNEKYEKFLLKEISKQFHLEGVNLKIDFANS